MSVLVKPVRRCLVALCALVFSSSCATSKDDTVQNLKVIVDLIDSGSCNAASQLIERDHIGRVYLHLTARNEIRCKKNKEKGKAILMALATEGYQPANDALIALGETPPATRITPIPPIKVGESLPVFTTPSPQVKTKATPTQRNSSDEIGLNVYLTKTTELIGARLCHYSDGTVRRVGGGAICPR